MKLPKQSDPFACVSYDETRPRTIRLPHLERTADNAGVVVSTDGWVMSVINVEMESDDTNGAISKEAVTAARRLSASAKEWLRCNSTLTIANGQSFVRPGQGDDAFEYPNWKQLVKSQPRKIIVAINPKSITQIAKAFGNPEKLRFEIEIHYTKPDSRSAPAEAFPVTGSPIVVKPISKLGVQGFALLHHTSP